MDAQGRKVVGDFPGYNGPALPRAMRSSRGRGEAAQRQSNFGDRTGFFELLATVAGQFLDNAGVGEEQDGATLGDPEKVEGKFSSGMDLQLTGIGGLLNQVLPDGTQPATISSLIPCLDALDEASRKEGDLKIDGAGEGEADATKDNDDVRTANCEPVALGLLQEESNVAVVKDIPLDEGNIAPVQRTLSVHGDQMMPDFIVEAGLDETPLVSDTSQLSGNPASRLGSVSLAESLGGTAIKQCPAGECVEPYIEGVGSEEVMKDKRPATLNSVEDVSSSEMVVHRPCGAHDSPPCSPGQHSTLSDVSEAKMEYSRGLGEFKAGWGPVQEVVVKKSGSPVPESEPYGNITGISDDLKPAMSVHVAEIREENGASMELEDKTIILNANNSPTVVTSGVSQVAAPGAVGSESDMLESAASKRNAKFSRKEKINSHQSSHRCLPETTTGKLNDSYRKGMKARKVAKAVKHSRGSGKRSKCMHTDMESTDSGSSEEAMSGNEAVFGGIAAFTRQRTARGLPAKKRKIVDGSANPSPMLHVNTNKLVELGYNCVDDEPPAAAAKLRSAKAASVVSSPTVKGPSKLCSKKSMEPNVKLSIKSFTIPELCVDLPESATVASLKKAVMDAAMNLLGEGLRVRVLLQGKKVPDEGATLSQMGISRCAKPESLGFMLEPSPVPTSPSATSEDPLLVLSRAANQTAPGYPVFGVSGVSGDAEVGGSCPGKGRSSKGNGMVGETDVVYGAPMPEDQQGYIDGKRSGIALSVTPDDSLKGCNGMKPKSHLNEQMSLSPHSTRVAAAGALAAIRAQADASRRAKNELEPPPTLSHNVAHNSIVGGSGAIILHPSMGSGENLPGMALVPLRQKSRALDIGKRRVRRPFSVAEVEVLVHAVEKLGTGRWRDVKLRAFDQAKHRTYVDLKDKWKTLVHTARIAPHQRRGEPVPEELLERVTQAHSYWKAQAAEQQTELDY